MTGYSLWDRKRVGHDLVTKQKTTKIICRYILEILQVLFQTTAVKLVFQKKQVTQLVGFPVHV